ncbi:hypothetical protein vseg_010208 [Gypsophila vaccaria]
MDVSFPSSSGGEFEDTVYSNTLTTSPVLTSGVCICFPEKWKAGRKKFKETRHPVYRGVRQRDGGKWVKEVRGPCKKSRIWVRTYPTADLAAKTYDVDALALRGEQAVLNFPDSAQLAPKPKSTSPRHIIRLAALQATKLDLHTPSDTSSDGVCSTTGEEKISSLEYPGGEFFDEEAIFNLPALINSMAEGMLLTPPALKKSVHWDEIDINEHDCYIDLDLWKLN